MPFLSPHLSLEEALHTAHREYLTEQANPPASVLVCLRRLAVDVFEPIHALTGRWHISSGWRCPELNLAVGGTLHSRHMEGLALDAIPLDMPMLEAYLVIKAAGIPALDQLIYEKNSWIHMGAARHELPPRHDYFMLFGERYEQFDPMDERLAV